MKDIYPIRVQKYLSRCGKGSRRACDGFVLEGRVSINGEKVIEPGTKVNEGDMVTFDGEKASLLDLRYFILNKPKGYISVNKDLKGRKWVVDLIEDARDSGCFPVGRLDLDTTGTMMITNDGELSFRISHPKFEIKKEYKALIKGVWSIDELKAAVKDGVEIDRGELVETIDILEAEREGDRTSVTLTIHEGRKHVVKRIFLSVGSRVYELERTAIGQLRTDDLDVGQWKEVDIDYILYRI